jgi:hypothetical protein
MKKLRSYENRELFMQVAEVILNGVQTVSGIRDTISYRGSKKECSAAISMMVKRKFLKSSNVPQSRQKLYHLDKQGIKLYNDIHAGVKKVGKSDRLQVFNVQSGGGVSGINAPTSDSIEICIDESKKDEMIAELQKQLSEKDETISYLLANPVKDIKISLPSGRTPTQNKQTAFISKIDKEPTLKIKREWVITNYKNKYLDKRFFDMWGNIIPASTNTVNLHDGITKISRTDIIRFAGNNHQDFGNKLMSALSDKEIKELQLRIIENNKKYIKIIDNNNNQYQLKKF